jgi:membrane protease YdiL (CAAX protease family)
MNRKQIFTIISPILVLVTMCPIFNFLSVQFHDNWRISWILGLMIYWIIWGIGYPLLTIGIRSITSIIKPQKPSIILILLVLFPLIMTTVFKFIPGSIRYDKPDMFILTILIFSAFGNGFCEEIYWRGVFMKLFPKSLLFRIIWPSIFFGLWHYIPGSLNPESSHVIGLMIGAIFLGFYSSLIAWKTDTIWWSILIHVFGGIIVIL